MARAKSTAAVVQTHNGLPPNPWCKSRWKELLLAAVHARRPPRPPAHHNAGSPDCVQKLGSRFRHDGARQSPGRRGPSAGTQPRAGSPARCAFLPRRARARLPGPARHHPGAGRGRAGRDGPAPRRAHPGHIRSDEHCHRQLATRSPATTASPSPSPPAPSPQARSLPTPMTRRSRPRPARRPSPRP